MTEMMLLGAPDVQNSNSLMSSIYLTNVQCELMRATLWENWEFLEDYDIGHSFRIGMTI